MNREPEKERWAVWFLLAVTAAIYLGSAGIPSLLDDADSFYAVVAREMNQRRDWVTPYANTIRYLEKPPLFYWLISLSYAVSGAMNAFTARLPTALAVVALVFVTYKIGRELFGFRAGLFGGLALATSTGMFLFTRIILPDAIFTLMLSLLIYSFVRWERAERKTGPLLWMYAFAGLAVLAKGLIGIVFPAGILFFTLVLTGRWKDVWRLVSLPGIVLLLTIAVPWHVLAGTRNPGFYWFYFINEHLLRFLGKRYPKDYGTVPLVPFWLLHVVWLFPWSIYLLRLLSPGGFKRAMNESRRAIVLPLVWALTILLFFSFSSRLEYYTVPALPALALLAGAQCAALWEKGGKWPGIVLAATGGLIGIALIGIAATVSAGAPDSWLKLKDNEDVGRREQARLSGHVRVQAGEAGRADSTEQISLVPLWRQGVVLKSPRLNERLLMLREFLKGRRGWFSVVIAAAAPLLSLPALAQQPRPVAAVRVTVNDQAGHPVAAAQAQLRLGGAITGAANTDEKGVAEFTALAPGSYEVVVGKKGFEPLAQSAIEVKPGALLEVAFTLLPVIELKDSVNVSARVESPIEQGASPATGLQRTQVKNLPNKPATVADALPLAPGVVRSPQGELTIAGSGEHRSAFLVNSADVTDPATGQFGLTIPIDSVETINIFKTPYLAQYGRFTAGVVTVETRRGGDKWHFELNDPLPEFRFRSRRLRGLRDASPRLVFNGPLIANRLFLSEGFEYILGKQPVRTLPFPRNESKQESFNSFTQLDYIVSPAQTLTGTFHAAPQRRNFVNPDFFNPQPVTPSFRARDYTGTIIDRLTLGRNLLESTVGIRRSVAGVGAQGSAEMLLTPTGNRGNYFSSQDRHAARVEWLETFSLRPLNRYGAHNLKFGTAIARTSYRGDFDARLVNILDAAGRPVQRIEFAGGQSFNHHDLESGVFGQDHWVITPKLALDAGVRFERQGITGVSRFAPRIGVAWTPFAHQQTVIRGGVGVFYDRVPLSVYGFASYPEQVVTKYAPDGTIVDGSRRFANITGQAAASRFPFIRGGRKAGNFAPYSTTWSIELEHNLSNFLRLRANYLGSASSGVPIITPGVVPGGDALILSGGGKSSYRQLELTARLSWKEGREMFFSYVRSRAMGDLNEFSHYLGNFPFAIVRPNQSSNLPGDLPNRFLAWGVIKLPWQMQLAPIVEYRSGFPYSVTDVARNYVGTPNKSRFPNFFSFDARISKDFKVNDKYSLRFAVSGFNLTNHFNALDVHANTADPQVGVFFGNHKRRFRVDFDVIY